MKRLFVIMPHNFGNSIYLNIKERDRFYEGAWNVEASPFLGVIAGTSPAISQAKEALYWFGIADQVRNDG